MKDNHRLKFRCLKNNRLLFHMKISFFGSLTKRIKDLEKETKEGKKCIRAYESWIICGHLSILCQDLDFLKV